MFFKKLDFPKIPESLKNELFEDFESMYKNPPSVNFDLYAKDQTLLTQLDNLGPSGHVKIYPIVTALQKKLSILYRNTVLDNYIFTYQVVEGGNYVSPHIDPETHRHDAYYYILSTGDTAARTVWYKQVNENTELKQAVGITYDNIIPVAEVTAEQDNWYWFKLDEIHSVENLAGRRIMIFCLDKSEIHKYI